MKKGCLIIIGLAVCLGIAGIALIYYAADQYEKQPKQPGEAEFFAAGNFIQGYEDKEGDGNSPAAVEFAQEYARKLRISRQALFTEGKAGAMSVSQGYFLTYCFAKDDSVAILVHVPELRRYAEDAKVTLAEYAWRLATFEVQAKFPKATKLALGMKGVLNYSAIFTGGVATGEDPVKGIQQRHPVHSDEALWPYFTPLSEPKHQVEQASEVKGAPTNPKP